MIVNDKSELEKDGDWVIEEKVTLKGYSFGFFLYHYVDGREESIKLPQELVDVIQSAVLAGKLPAIRPSNNW